MEANWTLTKGWTIICRSRRDLEEGGGAGPSSEPRRDQEQGDGAGIRKLDSCSSTAVAADIVFVTLLRTAVETAISGVHKLLRTGEVPTALT